MTARFHPLKIGRDRVLLRSHEAATGRLEPGGATGGRRSGTPTDSRPGFPTSRGLNCYAMLVVRLSGGVSGVGGVVIEKERFREIRPLFRYQERLLISTRCIYDSEISTSEKRS